MCTQMGVLSFTLISAYSCLEGIGDDFISAELSSEHGASSVKDRIIHNGNFKLAARSFVRENAYKKGEPNMTVQMFKDWMKSTYDLDVCHEIARLYLKTLGFNQVDHQKGVFFDVHEREDVVVYQCELMDKLEESDKKTISPHLPPPVLADNEKSMIRVIHDEFTFYSNADQTRFKSDGYVPALRQKSLGSNIMISDFIVEEHRYLKDDRNEARLLLETQKDGYFNSDMFLAQVDTAIDIFSRKFPDKIGIFMFDNAPSHRKFPKDGLNATTMNVKPGGKQPVMRDTVWDGKVQKMSLPDGNQRA